MTVAATTNRKTYTGDNVTTSFATSPVIFYLSSNLQVRATIIATGVSTLLTENTHYTVSGGSSAGAVGTINLAGGSSPHGALLSTEQLVILRVLPLTQASDFVNNSTSDAEVLEAALDKLTDVDQQIQEQADRSIRFASGDVSGSVTEMPDVTTRAGRMLGFDATGLLTTIVMTAGTSLVNFATSAGASFIGWIQAGTGAVLRTIQDKLREIKTSADNPTIGLHNTGVGETPLPAITSGAGNTSVGFEALKSVTTSDENTAVGYRALKSVTTTDGTTGRHNIALGSHALEANTSGRQNCAIGNQTLELNTIGSNNVAVGNGALDANVVSDGNTAVGVDALRLATGSLNTAVGVTALGNIGNASGNTAFGPGAGLNCLVGADNLFLGHFAGAYETGSNSFYIDNQDRTNTAGDKAKAMVYGLFNPTAANQRWQHNAVVTKPVQPAFLATGTLTTNVTGDATVVTVAWGTEIFDQHNDFAANTFTAPVAGRYHFDVTVSFNGLAAGNTLAFATLVATSRSITLFQINPSAAITGGELALHGGVDIDMALNDTVTVTIRADGGAKVVGYKANSSFSGHLVA